MKYSPVQAPSATAESWSAVFSALSRITSLREVRLSLRFQPDMEYDLGLIARSAGAGLAAKFVVDIVGDDGRHVLCQRCDHLPGRFILPAGNARPGAAHSAEDCPPFGRVVQHEPVRYDLFTDLDPRRQAFARERRRDLCVYCNRQCTPTPEDSSEAEDG